MTPGIGLRNWRDRDSVKWDKEDQGELGVGGQESSVGHLHLKCQLGIHV